MCDNAEHTVSIMKQSCPNLFDDDQWEKRCRRHAQRNLSESSKLDFNEQNRQICELKLTEEELTLQLIDFFKLMESITPCEYQECSIYALLLLEQSFSRGLFIHSQTVER